MNRLRLLFLMLLVILSIPSVGFSAENDYSLYYQNSRMFGKVLSYDPVRELAVLYGSIYVKKDDYTWSLIRSKKFEYVVPTSQTARNLLVNSINKTVVCTGSLNSWEGQTDEIFKTWKVEVQNYTIDTPVWYALGKTIRPERIYKTNLNIVTDFVDRLASLATVENIKEGSPPSNMQSIRNEFQKSWNLKWALTKDQNAANEQMQGVGGWQIYEGLVGLDNCYIERSPIIRKNFDNFMSSARTGGGSPEKDGSAVMFAQVNVSRDRYGKIINVTVSGPLFETVPELLGAFKNPATASPQTWRLEGWSQSEAENMAGKWCWISGTRVLVYEHTKDGKKVLVDQYFSLRNYLTQDEFNQTLNKSRDLIGEGGM